MYVQEVEVRASMLHNKSKLLKVSNFGHENYQVRNRMGTAEGKNSIGNYEKPSTMKHKWREKTKKKKRKKE